MQWNTVEWRKDMLRKTELELSSHYTVLDVGCGNAEDSKLIANQVSYVIGVDVRNSFRLPKPVNFNFIVASGCSLPFKDSIFHLVFEKDTLHHIQNHKKVIREMKRVVKKGGKVAFIEANRYNICLYIHMTLMKGHQHFSKTYFKHLLTYYFKDITFKSVESHVYPIKNRDLLRIIHFLEALFAKVPLIKNFLSYNIAIGENNE